MNLRFRTDHSKENVIFGTTNSEDHVRIHFRYDDYLESDCMPTTARITCVEGSRYFSLIPNTRQILQTNQFLKIFLVCTNKFAKNPVYIISIWISLPELGVLQSKNRMISALGLDRFVMMIN